MNDPYTARLKHLEQMVFSGPGQLAAEVRRAAALSEKVPAELETYIQKVLHYAYKVTDEDVAALLQAGYSEDQIFELTVSIALGAGLVRLKAGQAALEQASFEKGASNATS